MRVAVAQLNTRVGGIEENEERIVAAAEWAAGEGAEVLVTPELAVSGYPPEDWVLRREFGEACAAAVERLARRLPRGMTVVVGTPVARREGDAAAEGGWGRWYRNGVAVVAEGRVVAEGAKVRLPNEGVFDEVRYFAAGKRPLVVATGGRRVGVLICEDVWSAEPAQAAAADGAEVLVVVNASPFYVGKQQVRERVVGARARETGLGILYVNGVGGQDELVFDGGSFAVTGEGQVTWRGAFFREGVAVIRWTGGGWEEVAARWGERPTRGLPWLKEEEGVEGMWMAAIALAIGDFVRKCGGNEVVVGLSGGIDSALVTVLATAALGPESVQTVMMPSPYTAAMSVEDAAAVAAALGVRHAVVPIAPMMETFAAGLRAGLGGEVGTVVLENVQARIRGTLLMGFANERGGLVLTTGNKSELATGYATLYGDMAGAFAPIKDLYKTEVYRLARWVNQQRAVIPERVLQRAPSAELRPGQVDAERLPPYPVLDAILYRYVEEGQSPAAIVGAGFSPEVVEGVVRMVQGSEFKRRQAAVGPKVSRRAFGRDWRFPIAGSAGSRVGGKEDWALERVARGG
ncbi:MAG: NAD+ synthase [Hydrogenophilus sp.]|nr:NAD+ synthase [Hydrogenophilus sp.]